MKEHYTKEYFEGIEIGSARSAALVVPRLINIYHPMTVLDVGCGAGAWSREFLAAPRVVVGIDLYAEPKIDSPWFTMMRLDLEKPFRTPNPFDLILCLEVAEHLYTGGFLVDSLVAACKHVIIFSAATPGQGGGPTHVNEQSHDYWHRKFEDRGCFWHPLGSICRYGVDRWYRDNMFAYYPEVRREEL